MTAEQERALKIARIRQWLAEHAEYDGVVITHPANYAWLTGGGRGQVAWATETGVAALAVSRDGAWLVANNIEAARLAAEEAAAGFEVRAYPWWETHGLYRAVAALMNPDRILNDAPLGFGAVDRAPFVAWRSQLTPAEQERARFAGQAAAQALEPVVARFRPVWTERACALLVGRRLAEAGLEPIMVLVAGDDRVGRFRHPLPTDARLGSTCLVAVSVRFRGLVLSLTRLAAIHPSADTIRRQEAVASVFDALATATRPGTAYAALWAALHNAYRRHGYPDAWHDHHQGGLAGYWSRENRLTPDLPGTVRSGELYAWNPSLPGAKREETLLVGDDATVPLTAGPVYHTANPALVAPGLLDVRRL